MKPLIVVLCAALGCHREVRGRRQPAPQPALPPPAARTVAAPPALEDPESTWQRAAFAGAERVAAVEVIGRTAGGRVEVTVHEELRGFHTPRVMPLDGWVGDAAPGSRWLVAALGHEGASPAAFLLARVADDAAGRARVAALATPAWRYTPIVALVRIVAAPPNLDDRVTFEVVRVLRGTPPGKRWLDNAWAFEKARPLAAGPQEYVLSAWSVDKPAFMLHPMVWVEDLRPVDDLSQVQRDLAADPRAALERELAASTTALEQARTAWAFHHAAVVAEAEVVATGEEATGCGGLHYRMMPTRFLRAPAQPVTSCTVGACQLCNSQFPATVAGPQWAGGGHCYHGPERPLQHWLVAAPGACGEHSNKLEWSAAAEARVHGWLAAPAPRFGARVDAALDQAPDSLPAGHPVFEPALPPAALATVGWLRFRVVSRRDASLPDGRGYAWIRCEALADQGPGGAAIALPMQWTFAGTGLPAWTPGTLLAGVPLQAPAERFLSGAVAGPSLFAPAFLPGDDAHRLDMLLRAVERLRPR